MGSVQSATCTIYTAPVASEPVQAADVTVSVFGEASVRRNYALMKRNLVQFYSLVEGSNWIVDCSAPAGRGYSACEVVQHVLGGDFLSAPS